MDTTPKSMYAKFTIQVATEGQGRLVDEHGFVATDVPNVLEKTSDVGDYVSGLIYADSLRAIPTVLQVEYEIIEPGAEPSRGLPEPGAEPSRDLPDTEPLPPTYAG